MSPQRTANDSSCGLADLIPNPEKEQCLEVPRVYLDRGVGGWFSGSRIRGPGRLFQCAPEMIRRTACPAPPKNFGSSRIWLQERTVASPGGRPSCCRKPRQRCVSQFFGFIADLVADERRSDLVCHSEGGATHHLPIVDCLAPTEESTRGCWWPDQMRGTVSIPRHPSVGWNVTSRSFVAHEPITRWPRLDSSVRRQSIEYPRCLTWRLTRNDRFVACGWRSSVRCN